MKIDKTIQLAALAAIILAVAVFSLWESSEPGMNFEPAGNLETAEMETDWTSPHVPQNVLTEREHTQFVELSQRYSMEELERVFNPQTRDERQQANLENSISPLDHANFAYDWLWAEFVDGLGLSPEDAQLVRDIWIQSEAIFVELGIAEGDGTYEIGDTAEAQEEVKNQLFSRLSKILSPEQMTAFYQHEEQIITDFISSSQSIREELIGTGYSGLIYAADQNDLPAVQAYLASGADPNRLATDGDSAIHEAARNDNTEILRALIGAGADVNLTIPGDDSALSDATMYGNADAARVLIEAGANPNHRSNPDNPFSVAITTAALNGDTEMVRLLLDAGADVTGVVGEFALEDAIRFGDHEMEQMLIDAGANADAPRVTERRSFFDLGRWLGPVND